MSVPPNAHLRACAGGGWRHPGTTKLYLYFLEFLPTTITYLSRDGSCARHKERKSPRPTSACSARPARPLSKQPTAASAIRLSYVTRPSRYTTGLVQRPREQKYAAASATRECGQLEPWQWAQHGQSGLIADTQGRSRGLQQGHRSVGRKSSQRSSGRGRRCPQAVR